MPAEIRPLESHADYLACVGLQREIWGEEFLDVVPPSLLKVSQRIGGVASGAFDDGRLVGFVFGLTGVKEGRIVHWSDMLAVSRDFRNSGIGTLLKAHQRERVVAAGARTIYWTFDPLIARNAHINFNKLGATAGEYVRDMYGTTASELHGGMPTDRLVVAWEIGAGRGGEETGDPVAAFPGPDRDAMSETIRNRMPVGARPQSRIPVPLDFEDLLRRERDAALEWRMRTRHAFEEAFAGGMSISGFAIDRPAGEAWYVLAPRANEPGTIGS